MITLILIALFVLLIPFAPVYTFLEISNGVWAGSRVCLITALKLRRDCRKYGKELYIKLPFKVNYPQFIQKLERKAK